MGRRMAIFRWVANGGAGCRVGADNGYGNRLKSRVDGKSTQMGLRIDVNVEKSLYVSLYSSDFEAKLPTVLRGI